MAVEHELEIIPVVGPGDLAAAMAIREVVFIEEQRVPVEIERDDEDPSAHHVLAQDRGHAVGTGRLVEMRSPPTGEHGRWGQIGRMAVLVAYRRHGVGSFILKGLEEEARRRGLAGIVLHAQLHAHAFYEGAGYRNHGTIFEEAGIPHLEMRKRLGAVAEGPQPSQPAAAPAPVAKGRAPPSRRVAARAAKGLASAGAMKAAGAAKALVGRARAAVGAAKAAVGRAKAAVGAAKAPVGRQKPSVARGKPSGARAKPSGARAKPSGARKKPSVAPKGAKASPAKSKRARGRAAGR